ncbi:MAG: hypothetical protein COV67_01690 [Nitrospinae bacterium CG11_big_fil_rev_8_21_14_0_20_56_8]|nr:MAG: hypothetical protein COV67_01690 [Nitrospinae bacterium CG11_big_fil_rev_8_21_14_0_20_56_8]
MKPAAMRPMLILSFALFFLLPGGLAAQPAAIQEKGCANCHRFSAEGETGTPAPDLFYAGNKFQKTWLNRFLQKPEVIRKSGYSGRADFPDGITPEPHPALNAKEAQAVAEYLLSLKLPDLKSVPIDPQPLSKAQTARVKILFERDYGCIACHESINLAGKVRGGVSGPSLYDAGNRLQPEWIVQWIESPDRFMEKGRMPRPQLDGETAVNLAKYIMTLRKELLKE